MLWLKRFNDMNVAWLNYLDELDIISFGTWTGFMST